MLSAAEAPKLNHKEREHLAVLQRRLDHLREEHPERSGDPAYPPGEANALAWVMGVLVGDDVDDEVRIDRLDRALQKVSARLGRVEKVLRDEAEEEAEEE